MSTVENNKRILDFLAQGFSPQQVMNTMGISPAYLKAVLEDSEFIAALEEARKPFLKEANEEELISNKYLSLEHSILKRIEETIPSAELRDAVRALDTVANRQEKRASRELLLKANGEQGNRVVNIINLSLPAHAIPEYRLNSEKEVIAIDGKGMSPLSSEGVKTLFKNLMKPPIESQAI